MVFIETQRLVLRQWKDEDKESFARINADPQVMEFFPAPLTKAESDELLDSQKKIIDEKEYGLFAVEEKESGTLIGFTGLSVPNFEASFMPALEIGWRIDKNYWGKGLATEAAKAVLDFCFYKLKGKKIVSFTSVKNEKSIKLMKKIGLISDPSENFKHPKLPSDHPLAMHVLYRKI